MNEDLAEETGIHIGDGSLEIPIDKQGYPRYRYRIDGNLKDEYIYHNEFIKPLMVELYNCPGFTVFDKSRNSIQSNFRLKLLTLYKKDILGLPLGSKHNITIPKEIKSNDTFVKRCLVGIFDTDFSITSSMNLKGRMTSLKLMKEIHEILDKFNIKHSYRLKNNFADINIRKKGTIHILNEWGLHNDKHVSKYDFWKKFKTYLPYTYTEERLAVLKGKMDIEELKLISLKRKKNSIAIE